MLSSERKQIGNPSSSLGLAPAREATLQAHRMLTRGQDELPGAREVAQLVGLPPCMREALGSIPDTTFESNNKK